MIFAVYSRKGCPYCEKIVEVLQLSKQQFVVYSLDQQFTREQFYHEFGKGSTFPQIIMNGKKLGGCTDTVKYLQENNLV